ncbi:MAG: peptidoglycan bridge formation glycyltransferase FemA/FemB family protein [Bacteroidetes bacterium]|nr:peptidoglycan bridge formation glycyltransferase FemA/FemB family protein [Bacteroidota bacterium]
MELRTASDIRKTDIQQWGDFVKNHPRGTVFQSPEMFRLFEASRNFNPVVIIARDEKRITGVLLAVIIREFGGPIGFFSSRTVVYGGPLIDNGASHPDNILSELLQELIYAVKNRSVFIQFRNFDDRSTDIPVFESHGFRYMERLNYLLDTTDAALVKKRMSKSKWRQIRKGLEAGAEIIEPENEAQIKDFYHILHNLYQYKVKKPLPRYSFFRNFYHHTQKKETGIIRLVKYEGRIIGGILSPVFQDKVIYEWYVCGLDQEYKHVYPSVLATWAAIDYAIEHGLHTFDFMGVGVPDKDYGVREFKSKFGGEMVNYGRFGRINNHFIYTVTEIGFNVLALLRKI